MVLDSKAMEWGSQQGLDTAALKKAKVPIYGKWYFPDLPAGVALVNLQTGAVERFGEGFRAGAVLYVSEDDLKRAGLGPYAGKPVAAVPSERPAVSTVTTPESRAPAPAPTYPEPAHVEHHDDDHHGHAARPAEHAHPSPKVYIIVALILAAITAVEVAVYYIPALLFVIVPTLLFLSVIKFGMVVGWFMHLRFDAKIFTSLFLLGLGVAMAMIISLIFLFHGVGGGAAAAH